MAVMYGCDFCLQGGFENRVRVLEAAMKTVLGNGCQFRGDFAQTAQLDLQQVVLPKRHFIGRLEKAAAFGDVQRLAARRCAAI